MHVETSLNSTRTQQLQSFLQTNETLLTRICRRLHCCGPVGDLSVNRLAKRSWKPCKPVGSFRKDYTAQRVPEARPSYGDRQYGSAVYEQYPPPPPPERQTIAQLPRQGRPPPPRFSQPPPDEPTLSSRDVIGKQVITRTSGVTLGIVDYLLVDPDTLTIVSANLRAKGLSLSTSSAGNLLLDTFCQVGDVVLVHDESALDFVPQDETLGFVNLIGCSLFTNNGTSLGKVREFTFSPESGCVDLMKYDALGFPSLPERLIGVWQIGVESVNYMINNKIFLLPQSEDQIRRLTDGPLELAMIALQNLFQNTGPQDKDDIYFKRWKEQYGDTFLRHYNMDVPETRKELESFYEGLRYSGSGGPAAPRSLPPGRQAPMSEALQANPQERVLRQRETLRARNTDAALREDPRRRQAMRPEGAPPRSAQQSWRPQGPPSTIASIPIINQRPGPPYRQRDADGRYGEQQDAYEGQRPSSKMFDEWVDAQPEAKEAAVPWGASAYTSMRRSTPQNQIRTPSGETPAWQPAADPRSYDQDWLEEGREYQQRREGRRMQEEQPAFQEQQSFADRSAEPQRGVSPRVAKQLTDAQLSRTGTRPRGTGRDTGGPPSPTPIASIGNGTGLRSPVTRNEDLQSYQPSGAPIPDRVDVGRSLGESRDGKMVNSQESESVLQRSIKEGAER